MNYLVYVVVNVAVVGDWRQQMKPIQQLGYRGLFGYCLALPMTLYVALDCGDFVIEVYAHEGRIWSGQWGLIEHLYYKQIILITTL